MEWPPQTTIGMLLPATLHTHTLVSHAPTSAGAAPAAVPPPPPRPCTHESAAARAGSPCASSEVGTIQRE